MRVTVTTAPASEPVTTAEAKAFLRVTGTDEDTLIGALITGARQAAERWCRRSFVTQTLTLTLDAAETAAPIDLPRGPVASVSSVTETDKEAATTVTTSSAYFLAGDRLCASQATGAADWPSDLRTYDGLAVEYVAGEAAADVPQPIKDAILLTVADLFENRGSVVVGTVVGRLPLTARTLLAPYRRVSL